ncbi:hypothetical protein pEaSNUABM35_00255 [Erwinia phage pEa_SNUABM_35]|uniref:Uncharacterized protein n=1 Tax=Erwinia phage pEa_SNUABM_35 TaxID=2869557 RepID=A0AAE7XPW0_9CAUD|nr:hypothetical protein MPK65_gp255 [Erwinia phage pEa_SNUABM_35]QZE60172.1 hypothetical protein pEaSNUABM35_00255 [Erwinia phage pEa_SNUABM_35]QZE60508.1 hypothetical protein pEaSNUABM36_00255 [Erwinia phage pEa_SNUABM_36]
MTTIASLGARFAASSSERCSARKKKDPKNKTITCAGTTAMYNAVERLAIKLNVSRSRAVEIAIEQLMEKHGIVVEGADDN